MHILILFISLVLSALVSAGVFGILSEINTAFLDLPEALVLVSVILLSLFTTACVYSVLASVADNFNIHEE